MDVKDLFYEDGTRAPGVQCGKCGQIWSESAREAAVLCCARRFCACGEPAMRLAFVCLECDTAARKQRETDRWEAAELAKGHEGMVWVCDDFGHPLGERDGYYDDLDSMREMREGEPPAHVYACVRRGLDLSAERVLEDATEEHHEDAYHQAQGLAPSLQGLLAWWERAPDLDVGAGLSPQDRVRRSLLNVRPRCMLVRWEH